MSKGVHVSGPESFPESDIDSRRSVVAEGSDADKINSPTLETERSEREKTANFTSARIRQREVFSVDVEASLEALRKEKGKKTESTSHGADSFETGANGEGDGDSLEVAEASLESIGAGNPTYLDTEDSDGEGENDKRVEFRGEFGVKPKKKSQWEALKAKFRRAKSEIKQRGFFAWLKSVFGGIFLKSHSPEIVDEKSRGSFENAFASGKDNPEKGIPSEENFAGGKIERSERTGARSGVEARTYNWNGALESLKKALKRHPEWHSFAREASIRFSVPVSAIFAIINFESAFNPNAENKYSSASGLGQFVSGTWESMRKYLPKKLRNRSSKDPEAGIFAIAAYCAKNAKTCGIDLNSPDAIKSLYEAHHEGAAGYKRLLAFREKGRRFKVPVSYRNKKFKTFAVEIGGADDCENYSLLISRMAERVQSLAEAYADFLEKSYSPDIS